MTEQGLVIWLGKESGIIRSPGKRTRYFSTVKAPPGLKKLMAVEYEVVLHPHRRHHSAENIRIMPLSPE